MNVDLRWVVWVLMGVWVTGIAHAGPSLLAFYDVARAHAPELQATRLLRDVAREKREQALAGLRPTLRLQADAGRELGASAFDSAPSQDRAVHNWAWSLQLTQALLRPGATNAVKQSDVAIARAEAELQLSEQALMLRVCLGVLEWLAAQRDVQVAETHQHVVQQQALLAFHSFKAGLTAITDVHEANAQLHLVGSQLALARGSFAQREEALIRLLGVSPWSVVKDPVAMDVSMDDDLLVSDGAVNVENHPTVVGQRLALHSAEIEVMKQAQAHGPTVELTLGFGRNASTGSMTAAAEVPVRSRALQAGVRFSLPLYEGGLVVSRVREAELQREKADVDLRLSIQQLESDVRLARAAMVHEKNRIEALALALKASEDAVGANRVGYRVGTRVGLDVLNAEQQRFSTARDMYKAKVDWLMHSFRLKAARGVLAEADLFAITFDALEASVFEAATPAKDRP